MHLQIIVNNHFYNIIYGTTEESLLFTTFLLKLLTYHPPEILWIVSSVNSLTILSVLKVSSSCFWTLPRSYSLWLRSKESACNAGDTGNASFLHGGLEDLLEGYGNTLYYLSGESYGRGAWWATVHRVTKSQTQLKWLNNHASEVYIRCWWGLVEAEIRLLFQCPDIWVTRLGSHSLYFMKLQLSCWSYLSFYFSYFIER